MRIDEKDFILIIESLRTVRAMIDLNTPYTRNIRVDRDEIIELTKKLVEYLQNKQQAEPTTADEFNNATT